MQKVAILGANGQLGHDLTRVFRERGDAYELMPLTHKDLEISDYSSTRRQLEEIRPFAVINTTAFHQVDVCEDLPEKAFMINAFSVRNLAEICRDLDALLIHLSTDYVFGGDLGRKSPYFEGDAPFPVSVYGVSKLAGEYFVRAICPKHLVIRSSGLFGVAGSSGKGGNFVETMIRLAKQGKRIKVVDDQITSPTYTFDLASIIFDLVPYEHSHIIHITNHGDCSWFEFAQKIFGVMNLSADLSPTSTLEYGAKAQRPRYSVLGSSVLSEMHIGPMRNWHEALAAYLRSKSHL